MRAPRYQATFTHQQNHILAFTNQRTKPANQLNQTNMARYWGQPIGWAAFDDEAAVANAVPDEVSHPSPTQNPTNKPTGGPPRLAVLPRMRHDIPHAAVPGMYQRGAEGRRSRAGLGRGRAGRGGRECGRFTRC